MDFRKNKCSWHTNEAELLPSDLVQGVCVCGFFIISYFALRKLLFMLLPMIPTQVAHIVKLKA